MPNLTHKGLPEGYYCTEDKCIYPRLLCDYCARKRWAPELIERVLELEEENKTLKEGLGEIAYPVSC